MQGADDSAAFMEARKAFAAAKQTYMEEAQLRFRMPDAQQQEVHQVILTVFQAACKQLEQDHAGLIEVDKENARVLNNRQAPDTVYHIKICELAHGIMPQHGVNALSCLSLQVIPVTSCHVHVKASPVLVKATV